MWDPLKFFVQSMCYNLMVIIFHSKFINLYIITVISIPYILIHKQRSTSMNQDNILLIVPRQYPGQVHRVDPAKLRDDVGIKSLPITNFRKHKSKDN